ncbi:EAL domain-containing response regulator [Vibrio coralliirubri]|uniref:EAL domain-containing response regulator n=1 Tax=Vibrio coralliirubri TaxID=1516159 RepID=UPI000A36813D|nr:EAL domain-containing response regulator [Vibrio coralliirubri]
MKKAVLIVDDVEFSRELLSSAILNVSYETIVHSAENANQAINKLEKNSYDLIITDIMMPGGDGFELLKILSKKAIDSKIIITSGLDKSIVSSVSMLGKLYELNVVASLEKPIWLEQVTELAESALAPDKFKQIYTCKELKELKGEDYPIKLLYQPQVISDEETICGFEVLSRWSANDGELIPPNCFLPMIESLGKQKAFTKVVLEKFVEDYHNYFKDIEINTKFSINVDPSVLIDEQLFGHILSLYEGGVTHTIVIEITEQGVSPEIECELLERVLQLRLAGFEISVDDFGVNASNIERVMRLPINELKIDKQITWAFHYNSDYMQLLNEVRKLASAKSARVVYEGVESQEMVSALEAINGYYQQGFFYGVPTSPQQAREMTFANLKS